MNTLSFFISSLIIIFLPGTGVIYTISTGIAKGKKASLLASIGCTAGIIPHLCLSVSLSSFLLQMNHQVFHLIKGMGVLYLLYLGVGMLVSKSELNFTVLPCELKTSSIIRQGILINLLNPKLTLFFFSFLPQYISTNKEHYFLQYFILSSSFMFLTFLVFSSYGFLASNTRKIMERSSNITYILPKCFGLIFIIFAIQLGFSSI